MRQVLSGRELCPRLLIVVSFALVVGVSPGAQGPLEPRRNLDVTDDIDETGLDFAVYNPGFHTQFAEILQLPGWRNVESLALVISNNSSHSIEGIALRWGVSRNGGPMTWSTLRADSFEQDEMPVVPAKSSALALPDVIVPDTMLKASFAVIGPALRSRIAPTDRVVVTVDSVILDDGRILGPDGLRFAEDLQSRQRAALALLTEIRQLNGDAAIAERLSAIASPGIRADTDQTTKWRIRLARRMTRMPDVLEALTSLAEAPALSR